MTPKKTKKSRIPYATEENSIPFFEKYFIGRRSDCIRTCWSPEDAGLIKDWMLDSFIAGRNYEIKKN